MARKTYVELIDDIDGSQAEESVSFSLDGIEYEIDLSEENARKLRADIGEWTGNARRVAGRRIRGTGNRPAANASGESAKIRAWAREQGKDVSDRGRIPANLRNEYLEANPGL
jgi:hypothetical protein